MKQNEKIAIGSYHLEVLHTPGHTFESSCYVLENQAGHQLCVFTGDTLFIGDVGRPDLAQAASKTPQDMARMLYKSLKSLKSLPSQCIVLPGHGAGSACGKAISGGDRSTIGDQLKENAVFKEEDEATFIHMVTEGLAPPPGYWSMDVSMNKATAIKTFDDILSHSLHPLSPKKVQELAADPHVFIVDTRKPEEFAHCHIPGSLAVQYEQSMEVWTAYVVDPRKQEKIILIVPAGKEKEAITRLARTGLDCVVGYLEGGFEAWKNEGLPTTATKVVEVDSEESVQNSLTEIG